MGRPLVNEPSTEEIAEAQQHEAEKLERMRQAIAAARKETGKCIPLPKVADKRSNKTLASVDVPPRKNAAATDARIDDLVCALYDHAQTMAEILGDCEHKLSAYGLSLVLLDEYEQFAACLELLSADASA